MDVLERGPILLELSRLVHEAGGGRGRIVFVGGEAGIGKTVLMRRLREMVGGSARVLFGACDPVSTPRPLAPFMDVAAQLDRGRWGELHESAPRRDALFQAFLDEISTGSKPTRVIFEDIHWADDATLDLLRYLARRIENTRALLVATYRDDEVSDVHPLRTMLGDLATSTGIARRSVPPLSLEAVRTLAAGSGIDPVALHRKTGGNPFFVTEVLASGLGGIPETVRDAVLARAARLPAEARAVLEAGAAIGYRIEPWLPDAIGIRDVHAIDLCVRSGILQGADGVYSFRHELSRDAVHEAILPARKRELHRRVLEALRSRTDGAADPARLAHHAEGAGDGAAVLKYAPEAAQRAIELSAHREAAAQFARALRFADSLSTEEHAKLLEKYSYECATIGRYEDAIHADEEIIRLWREAGDRLKEGWAHTFWASCLVFSGRTAQAHEASRRSIEILESLPESPELAEAYAFRSGLYMFERRNPEAIDWGKRAIEVAKRQGDGESRIAAMLRVGGRCS